MPKPLRLVGLVYVALAAACSSPTDSGPVDPVGFYRLDTIGGDALPVSGDFVDGRALEIRTSSLRIREDGSFERVTTMRIYTATAFNDHTSFSVGTYELNGTEIVITDTQRIGEVTVGEVAEDEIVLRFNGVPWEYRRDSGAGLPIQP